MFQSDRYLLWSRLFTVTNVIALELMVALLVSSSLADPLSGQPQDLPLRLALFGVMALALYGVGRWISPLLRGPTHQAKVPELDPEELAYLDCGAQGVMKLALAMLVDRGILQADPESRTIVKRMLNGQPLSKVEQWVLESYESLTLQMYEENGVSYISLVSSERFLMLMESDCFLRHSLQAKQMLLQPCPLFLVDYLPILGVIYLISLAHATNFVWVAIVMHSLFFFCLGFAADGRRTRWGDKVLSFYRESDAFSDPWLRVALEGPDALPGRSLNKLRELIRRAKIYAAEHSW